MPVHTTLPFCPHCFRGQKSGVPGSVGGAEALRTVLERRQHHVGDQLVDVQGEVGRFARLNPYLVSMHAAIHIRRMYILGGLYILGGVFPQSVHFTPHSVRIVSAAKSPEFRDLSGGRKLCGQFWNVDNTMLATNLLMFKAKLEDP